ncbi:hypothetical protein D9M71_763350 [compost metagenome]
MAVRAVGNSIALVSNDFAQHRLLLINDRQPDAGVLARLSVPQQNACLAQASGRLTAAHVMRDLPGTIVTLRSQLLWR